MQPDIIGGRYRVLSAIGQGGMGTVWLCRDETLHREVAVKQVGLMPGESVTDSARALREARSSAALSHRNVVTVYDVVEENASVWLVMEHVPSRSLYDLVAQKGPLTPANVADIGAQVADGLAAAHAAGTVHRDVKPGNVLVREDGVAKISDFGIARSAGDPALTASGFMTGTPSYFSPELARGATPSAAADVWALGATLYAAVEGHPPYQAQRNPVAVLHEIASSQPPRPTRAQFLEPVLLRMMDRDPASRWTMADAAHGLRRLADRHAPERTRLNTLGLAPSAASSRARSSAELLDTSSTHTSSTHTPSTAPSAAVGATAAEAAPTAPAERDRQKVGTSAAAVTGGESRGRPARGDDGPPQGRPPARSSGPRPSRRGRWALLAVVVLLLVAAGIYALVRSGSGGNSDRRTAGSSSTSSSSGSRSASSSGSSPSSRQSESSSASASSSPSTSSSSSPSTSSSSSPSAGSSGGASGAAGQKAFLQTYYSVAPGGTDAGWSRLGPGEKQQGRASYDRFWGGIKSVDVSDVRPVDSDSLDLTLTYHKTNGQLSRERQRVDLVRSSGGGYLINNDDVIG